MALQACASARGSLSQVKPIFQISYLMTSEMKFLAILVGFCLTLFGSESAYAACSLLPSNGIACVQSNSKTIAGTNGTIAFSNSNGSNNTIIVVLRTAGGVTTSVTDTRNNTYLSGSSLNVQQGSNWLSIYYAQKIASGTNTLTITAANGTSGIRVAVFEYSGLATSDVLDQAAGATGNSNVPASPSVTTTSAPELAIGSEDSGSAVSITSGAGYSLEQCRDSCANGTLGTEDKILSSNQSLAATWSVGGSVSWAAIIATFRSAGIRTGENAYCNAGTSGELTEGTPTWGASDGIAELDNRCFYTGMDATPSPGFTHHPGANSAADLITLLSLGKLNGQTLACGDIIELAANSTYQAPNTSFVLPNLSCDGAHWITIRTSKWNDPNFPPEHTQATPCLAGISNDAVHNGGVRQLPGYPDYPCPSYPTVLTARIQAPGNGLKAISVQSGANHYRFIGIEIAKTVGAQTGALVDLSPDKFTQGGSHIIFDRSLIHGEAFVSGSTQGAELGQGISANNSQWVADINGWNYDSYCNSSCVDSHNFGFGTGAIQDGPFKIYNEVYATAGEPFMGGGGGAGIGTPNSRGIEVRGNLLLKPLAWMVPIDGCGNGLLSQWKWHPITKNLGELKNGTHALIEGNSFWNSWQGCQSDQAGFALGLGPRSQNNHFALRVQFNGTNTVTSKDGQFLHNCGGQANCRPDDVANCPPGGCILEIADQNRPDNNGDYRFCNGQNGCAQTGDLASTASLTASVPVGGKCSNNATQVCNVDTDCGTGNYCYAQTNSCVPGDCPSCRVDNITVRYNDFYNVINGIQIGTGVSSHCKDESAGADHYEIRDNVLHGLSVEMTNAPVSYTDSQALAITNGQVGAILNNVEAAHNTVAIESEGGTLGGGGLGVQRDATDIKYLQGFNLHDNVSIAAWHVSHSQGSGLSGGLANTYQTDSCQQYYPNDANNDVVGGIFQRDVSCSASSPCTFTFTGGSGNYIVTRNGVSLAVINKTAGSFQATTSFFSSDAFTVRDVNACNWTFVGNILGTSLAGGSRNEAPYPANNPILDGSNFTNIFSSWQPRSGGNYAITSPTYQGTASDASSRGATGKDPGADVTTWGTLTGSLPHVSIFYPSVAITSGTLPTATHGVAYQASLQISGGGSPYNSWWLETNPANCNGNCGSLPNSAGIVIGRDGTVNGLFRVQTASRSNAGVSSFNLIENPIAGVWTVGQAIVLSGFDNTKGGSDSTFNGPCTITAVTNSMISCPQSGGVIGSHNVNNNAMMSFAPITPGTYTFWVGVRDGAFQLAWHQISVPVN